MRYLYGTLSKFAETKFVLLAGPRQVGKTTLAKEWLQNLDGQYLNWDIGEQREQILKKTFLNSKNRPKSLLLDEIHKYPRWKNYLKGLYDELSKTIQVVVTGSARLDIYRKGGDSLFGRHELLRLHPFSIGELMHGTIKAPPTNWLDIKYGENSKLRKNWQQLTQFGGFPEPFTLADPLQHQRWSLRRRELLIKEDLRDVSDIKLVELVEHLYILLPDRIGSALSINGLAEEIGVAFNTISTWLKVLDHLYISFRISPYHQKIARSLKKEQKLYFWDWSQVSDPAKRFENMVASHLLKSVNAWTDLGYGEYDLLYWRNKEKQEVDFVITNKRKPVVIFECKLSDDSISDPLVKLSENLGGVPAIQLVETGSVDYRINNARVINAANFLAELL